jgi:hypothetical protein
MVLRANGDRAANSAAPRGAAAAELGIEGVVRGICQGHNEARINLVRRD